MQELPKFEQAKQRLTPGEYRKHLQHVALREIDLSNLEAGLDRELALNAPGWGLEINMGVRIDQADTLSPTLFLAWDVIARAEEEPPSIRVKATYRLQLETKEVLPPDFFAIYQQLSATPQVWPYLRELVQSLTGRMGIPQLVLPLYKESVGSDQRTAEIQRQEDSTMAEPKNLPPGTPAPDSGQYGLYGPRGKDHDREVTVTKGEPLPPTPEPGMKYRQHDKTKHKGGK